MVIIEYNSNKRLIVNKFCLFTVNLQSHSLTMSPWKTGFSSFIFFLFLCFFFLFLWWFFFSGSQINKSDLSDGPSVIRFLVYDTKTPFFHSLQKMAEWTRIGHFPFSHSTKLDHFHLHLTWENIRLLEILPLVRTKRILTDRDHDVICAYPNYWSWVFRRFSCLSDPGN